MIPLTYRGVEQLAARWAHNPKVASSSLAPATKSKNKRILKRLLVFLLFSLNKFIVKNIFI